MSRFSIGASAHAAARTNFHNRRTAKNKACTVSRRKATIEFRQASVILRVTADEGGAARWGRMGQDRGAYRLRRRQLGCGLPTTFPPHRDGLL